MDDDRLKTSGQLFDYFDELLRRIQDVSVSEKRFYQKNTDIHATILLVDLMNQCIVRYYGYPDQSLIRYDNERGKGDHRHKGEQEDIYVFISVEQLIQDFKADIESLRGEYHE